MEQNRIWNKIVKNNFKKISYRSTPNSIFTRSCFLHVLKLQNKIQNGLARFTFFTRFFLEPIYRVKADLGVCLFCEHFYAVIVQNLHSKVQVF